MAGKTQIEHLEDCAAEGISLHALKHEDPKRIIDWFILVKAVPGAYPVLLDWLKAIGKEFEDQAEEKRLAGRKRDAKLNLRLLNYDLALPALVEALDKLDGYGMTCYFDYSRPDLEMF